MRADRSVGIGAGVGLALVRRIAQLHDGSIHPEDRALSAMRVILSFAKSETALRPPGNAERVRVLPHHLRYICIKSRKFERYGTHHYHQHTER